MTRYSTNLGTVRFDKDDDIGMDYGKEITEGNYRLDNVLSLVDNPAEIHSEFVVNLDGQKGISVKYKSKKNNKYCNSYSLLPITKH